MLHDLRKAGKILPVVQSLQHAQIHIDQPGHLECAYHILKAVEVHPCLPADTAVRLGEQGSGKLDIVNSPQVGGCRIACDIARNTASESQEHVLSVKALLNQKSVDIFHRVQRLVLLTLRKGELHRFPTLLPDKVQNLLPIELVYF